MRPGGSLKVLDNPPERDWFFDSEFFSKYLDQVVLRKILNIFKYPERAVITKIKDPPDIGA
jgi:hypothetical protein